MIKKSLLVLVFLLSFQVSLIWAENITAQKQVGLRFGAWSLSNQKHSTEIAATYEIKKTSLLTELFYSYGLKSGFTLDFSAGANFKGQSRYETQDGYFWQSVTIYPLSAGISFYPLSFFTKNKLQIYLDGGGSFIIGSQRLDYGVFNAFAPLPPGFGESQSTFGFYAGMGIGYQVLKYLLLDFDLKYRQAKFDSYVGGIKDHSGFVLALGAAYLFGKN